MKDPQDWRRLRSGVYLMAGLLAALVIGFTSDILGDYTGVTYTTGYLEFTTSSPAYRGNVRLPEEVEGIRVESRMPARILVEDYIDPATRLLDPQAVLQTLEDFQTIRLEHLRSYCITKTFASYEEDSTHIEAVHLMDSRNRDLAERARQAVNQRSAETCRTIDPAVEEAWMGRKVYAGYRFVEQRLNRAHELAIHLTEQQVPIEYFNRDIPEAIEFNRVLFEALEVLESLKLDNIPVSERSDRLRSLLSLASNYLKNQKIEYRRPEATDLIIPQDDLPSYPGQRFFSLEQQDQYEGDISALEPENSGFWRKPFWAVSSFNMTDYNRFGVSSLRRSFETDGLADIEQLIETVLNADIPVDAVYEKDDLSGRTPKVTVKIGGQNWKLKYLTHRQDVGISLNPAKIYKKRYMGSEVNVEPVVNHLAASIGYTVDPTYYQKEVHLYFPDSVYAGNDDDQAIQFERARREMISDLIPTYPDVNVPSAFQVVQQDETGRRYIVVRGCTLEKKSDESTDINLGYFIWGGFGRSFKRAFRAFSVFLAWVDDPDIKNGNVKFKLVPVQLENGETDYRLVFSASDMGGALGTGLPNLISNDIIERRYSDRSGNTRSLVLNYRTIHPAILLNAVSIADLRWIMRRIGQFRREQITTAFLYAGYPDVVARYYTEVLLNRRDQLLEVAGLLGATIVDDAGHEIQFERLSRMNHRPSFYIEGYESYFDNGFIHDPRNRLFNPTEGRSFFPQYWGTRPPW